MTSFIDTHCHLDKLESTPEETVKEAFSHVGIGGTWKPDQCKSQIEGNVL